MNPLLRIVGHVDLSALNTLEARESGSALRYERTDSHMRSSADRFRKLSANTRAHNVARLVI